MTQPSEQYQNLTTLIGTQDRALGYRQGRCERMGNQPAMDAADRARDKRWPELSARRLPAGFRSADSKCSALETPYRWRALLGLSAFSPIASARACKATASLQRPWLS